MKNFKSFWSKIKELKVLTCIKYSLAVLLVALFISGTYSIPLDYIKSLPQEMLITRSEMAELEGYQVRQTSELFEADSVSNPAFVSLDSIKSGFSAFRARLKAKIFGIPYKSMHAKVVDEQFLTLGGMPIGFNLNTKGVLVVGKNDIMTKDGLVSPSTLERGDIILSIEGISINSALEIAEVLNRPELVGKQLRLRILRNEQEIEQTIVPALDKNTNKYLLGIWIRDNVSGIGTVTYLEENGRFGSLGHPVADIDTGVVFPISSGAVYNCKIIGITKGAKGSPGELKGVFIKSDKQIGNADKNSKFGVFGDIENNIWKENEKKISVGSRNGVKPGKAKIRCMVQDKAEEYDVEIIKAKKQNSPSEKGMIVRIVDKRLLNLTGGIVQGMSGSPIIQNNKIVGAVTHVFLNDPTKGYGLYLDWMLGN